MTFGLGLISFLLSLEGVPVDGLEPVHEILGRAISAGVVGVGDRVRVHSGVGTGLGGAVVPRPDVLVGVLGSDEIVLPRADRKQLVAVVQRQFQSFGGSLGGILPILLAGDVVQRARRIEQSPGLHRLGGHTVRSVLIRRGKVSGVAESSVTAGLTGRGEIFISPLEILGAASVGLVGAESCLIPVVLGSKSLVKVRHSAEIAAEHKMSEASHKIRLPQNVIPVLLRRNILHPVDVLDGLVADSDDLEH